MKLKNLVLAAIIAVTVIACTTTTKQEVPPNSGNFQDVTIVDPTYSNTVSAVRGGLQTVNPTGANPVITLVDMGLAASVLIAGWIAKRKNDLAARKGELLTTVIQGVEAANNSEVKAAIQKHAEKTGTEGALSAEVFKETRSL